MGGDTAQFSPNNNDTGDPLIWRRIVWGDWYSDDGADWRTPTSVTVYNDGHIEAYANFISNNRGGFAEGEPDVNFWIQLEYWTDDAKVGGDGLMLYRMLTHGDSKDTVTRIYPVIPDTAANMGRATRICAFRHETTDAFGRDPSTIPTIPIPVPPDD